MGNLVWRVHTKPDSFWAGILSQKYLKNSSIINYTPKAKGSILWENMLRHKHHILGNLFWSVRDGTHIDAFRDRWIPGHNNSLNDQRIAVSNLISHDLNLHPRWSSDTLSLWWDADAMASIQTIPLGCNDIAYWKCETAGTYPTKSLYRHFTTNPTRP